MLIDNNIYRGSNTQAYITRNSEAEAKQGTFSSFYVTIIITFKLINIHSSVTWAERTTNRNKIRERLVLVFQRKTY